MESVVVLSAERALEPNDVIPTADMVPFDPASA